MRIWVGITLVGLVAIAPACRSKSVDSAITTAPLDSTPADSTPTDRSASSPAVVDNSAGSKAPAVDQDASGRSEDVRSQPNETASSAPIPDNCDEPATQLDMNLCAKAFHAEEDARLNEVYQSLKDNLSADRQAKLVAAEKAWIAFRDQNCAFVRQQVSGGSIEPSIYYGCLSQITASRTAELQQLGQASMSYEQADQDLNDMYQQLKAVVDAPHQDALTDAQLAWLKYRDANCAYEADEQSCLARMTEARTQDLKAQYEQWSL